MTKAAFLSALESEIARTYAWAADPDRLARFLGAVRTTLDGGEGQTASVDGPAFVAAWRAIGGKGKPTLKALRALI